MNNELEQHKNGDKIKWILTLIAFIIVGVMFVGIIFSMSVMKAKNDKQDEDTETVGGTLIPEVVENKGVSLMSAAIPVEKYADNGINPAAVGAVSVYVNNPSEFVTYKWTIHWQTAKSEAVTNAVKLSASTGSSVSVSALKAFDTQVILTCSAYIGESSKVSSSATCTIDYEQRFDGVSLNGRKITNGETIELSALVGADMDIVDALNDFTFNLTGNFGIGSIIPTVKGNVTVKSVMDMTHNDCTGSLPYSLALAGFIYEQIYLSPDYYLEGMLEGNSEAIAILYECVTGYDKDMEFTVNYTCGSDSGTITFYVNISDSLFASVAAQNVELNRSGIVL